MPGNRFNGKHGQTFAFGCISFSSCEPSWMHHDALHIYISVVYAMINKCLSLIGAQHGSFNSVII